MKYSKFLPKLKETASSKKKSSEKAVTVNKDLLMADLYCHLNYMTAISSSKLPRTFIFDYSSKLPYQSTRYIKEIHLMAQKLGYDYAEACRKVGTDAKDAEIRTLLLRLSSALTSGEKEEVFLSRESAVFGEQYSNEYDRRIESLKKWTDAYVALILSAALVVVISIVSQMIFPVDNTFLGMLMFVTLMTTCLGAWIMWRAAPKETKVHSLPTVSSEQRLARRLITYSLPVLAVIIGLLFLLKMGIGAIMLAAAVCLMPTGIVMLKDDRNIDKRDSEIAGLLRSLGGVAKAVGTSITEAIGKLDLRSFHTMEKGIKRLYNRLRIGIKPELCWQMFVAETGSEHVNRSVRMFWDGISLGGDPELIGNQSSLYAMKISLLREKRNMVASGFFYLVTAMQATITLLLVGIYHIMSSFGKMVSGLDGLGSGSMDVLTNLPAFQFLLEGSGLNTMNTLITALIIVLVGANAFAVKVVAGGHLFTYIFYLSVMLAVTGIGYLVAPLFVQFTLGSVSAMP